MIVTPIVTYNYCKHLFLSTPEVPHGLSICIFMFDLGLFKRVNVKVTYVSTVNISQTVIDEANTAIVNNWNVA